MKKQTARKAKAKAEPKAEVKKLTPEQERAEELLQARLRAYAKAGKTYLTA